MCADSVGGGTRGDGGERSSTVRCVVYEALRVYVHFLSCNGLPGGPAPVRNNDEP